MRRFGLSIACGGVTAGAHQCGPLPAVALQQNKNQQKRSMFVFSIQSKDLVQAQKKCGFKNDFWLGESIVLRERLRIKKGESPISARGVPRGVELFNADELEIKGEFKHLGEPSQHSSLSNKLPYQPAFQHELEDRAQMQSYRSKWWLGRHQAYKDSAEMVPKSKLPYMCRIVVNWEDNFYNLDQLETGNLFTSRYAFDGGLCEPFHEPANPAIYNAMQKRRSFFQNKKSDDKGKMSAGKKFWYESQLKMPNVYYSLHQLEALGLEPRDENSWRYAVLNQTKDTIPKEMGAVYIYNLCEFSNWKEILPDLPPAMRSIAQKTTEEAFLAHNGSRITAKTAKDRIKQVSHEYKNNLWVPEWQIKRMGLVLSDERRPYEVVNRVNLRKEGEDMRILRRKHTFIHISDLKDVEMAKRRFGTMVL